MDLDSFAESLSCSRSAISRYERGERVPDAFFLQRLKDIYGVDIEWLLDGAGEEEREVPAIIPGFRRADIEGLLRYLTAGYGKENHDFDLWEVVDVSYSPFVTAGDLLLVDLSVSRISRSGVYVLRTGDLSSGDDRELKYLVKKTLGDVEIRSLDGASESEYEPSSRLVDRIKGQVVWTGCRLTALRSGHGQ